MLKVQRQNDIMRLLHEQREISDSSKGERDVKLAMLERSEKAYFLFDSTKKGKGYPYLISDLSRVIPISEEDGMCEILE